MIATNREALKPLAVKVSEGIEKAAAVIPVITRNSMNTQWINQEIGFATAFKKKVLPIVEKDIINDLKGFIHKEIDLPYNFESNVNKQKENQSFIECLKLLHTDLENSISSNDTVSELSDFERKLQQVDNYNLESEFLKKREKFLESVVGLEAAKLEVANMWPPLNEKIKKLRDKGLNIGTEEDLVQQKRAFIVKCKGFSFSVEFTPRYSNSLFGSTLSVRKWTGHYTTDRNVSYAPGEGPKILSNDEYDFDVDRENHYKWVNREDKKTLTSEKLADNCLTWLIDRVTESQ